MENHHGNPLIHNAYAAGQTRFLHLHDLGEEQPSPYPINDQLRTAFWRGFYNERDDQRAAVFALRGA
jgi:hypothetical protein